MLKYLYECCVLVVQFLMFYIFPLFAGPTDSMGLVFFMLLFTFLLSLIITGISNNKIKYLYPVAVAILFLPTVLIYYNQSAFIHTAWYFVASLIGVLIGSILHRILKKIPKE